MPIRPFIQSGAFEPDAIAAMSEAFDAACKELQDAGQPDVAREVIAGRIIAAARLGERDPVRLREAALRKPGGDAALASPLKPSRLLEPNLPRKRSERFSAALAHRPTLEIFMKLSARNAIAGTVLDVTKGQTTAHVQLDIGGGQIITASITNEAVDELKLAKGQKAHAVIKASDVMIGIA